VSIGAAGREAVLASTQGGHHSIVEIVVLVIGLLLTIGAAILITRAAKKELVELRNEKGAVGEAAP
jgi:hypothetical protein